MMSIKNHINGAIVTGGASGIGRELVRELRLSHDICVLAIDIDDRGLQKLRLEVGCDIFVADITKPDFYEKFCFIDFTKFNWLINNAGLGYANNFNDTSSKKYTKEIDINIYSTVNLCHIFISKLRNEFGIITNMSSSSAFQPLPKISIMRTLGMFSKMHLIL